MRPSEQQALLAESIGSEPPGAHREARAIARYPELSRAAHCPLTIDRLPEPPPTALWLPDYAARQRATQRAMQAELARFRGEPEREPFDYQEMVKVVLARVFLKMLDAKLRETPTS